MRVRISWSSSEASRQCYLCRSSSALLSWVQILGLGFFLFLTLSKSFSIHECLLSLRYIESSINSSSLQVCMKEHMRDFTIFDLMISALAEQAMDKSHRISWEEAEVLAFNPIPISVVLSRPGTSVHISINEQRNQFFPLCLYAAD